MADETTTIAAVQPIQPQTEPKQELTALEKAQAADTRQVITLSAEQAYDELELFGTEPGTYRDDAPVQGEYWRFKFRGSIVTVSPEFKKAFDEGKLLGVTATPTIFERTVPDPNNAGMTKQIVGYGYSLAFSDLDKKQKAQKAIMAAKELGLKSQIQEVKMAKKLEYIKSDRFKIELTEEDMKMLDDAI